MTQGERVKAVRKSKEINLTMEKFGERLGVTKTAISLIESGKNNVTDVNIKAICREFNVDEHWLRTGEGKMFVEIDKADQLMEWAGKILGNESSSFKVNFVKLLMSLSEKEWEALEQKARELFDYRNEKDQDSP